MLFVLFDGSSRSASPLWEGGAPTGGSPWFGQEAGRRWLIVSDRTDNTQIGQEEGSREGSGAVWRHFAHRRRGADVVAREE